MYQDCREKFFKYFVNDKKMFLKYTGMSFITGMLELFGVALIYPFINRLISGQGKYTFLFGLVIVLAFLLKNIIMIFYNYLQVKFIKKCEANIIKRFMKFFLNADYYTVLKIPFAQKQQIVNYLIPNTINNFMMRILNLWVNFFIFGLITIFLFVKFFTASVITLICSIILVLVQYKYFKTKTADLALKTNSVGERCNRFYNESLLNIKNVKILDGEGYFYKKYSEQIDKLQDISGKLFFYSIIPPYTTEPFTIILLFILLAVISVQNQNNVASLIASYALIVSAVFRLAPIISRIQVNLTSLRATYPLAEKLIKYYEEYNIENFILKVKPPKLKIEESLEFKNISFSYDNTKVLDNISFKINKGEFIGISGYSGAGKTTLVDIISNLLVPDSGEILLDGKIIPSLNLSIGYIPQNYLLIQASIRENVALGFENIDDKRVVEVLKKAQLYDFIAASYKNGIYAEPFVDETGFSQGQKQRLAIARALYLNPDIIIMDEATSSLDLKTEDEICHVLNSLKGEKTIIAIAHRLSTIKSADRIIFLKNKQIAGNAAFSDLYNSNEDFRDLVELTTANLIH